jgi:hypothetical protein
MKMNEKLKKWLKPQRLNWRDIVIILLAIILMVTLRVTTAECQEIIATINNDPCYYCTQGIILPDEEPYNLSADVKMPSLEINEA